MNCKPGDVAMFKRDALGARDGVEYVVPKGTFVYVKRIAIRSSLRLRRVRWHVEPFTLRSKCGKVTGTVDGVDDAVLKPIRPGGGEDEMLRIAGKPETVVKPNEVTT